MFDYEDYEWAEINGMFDSEEDNGQVLEDREQMSIVSPEELFQKWG